MLDCLKLDENSYLVTSNDGKVDIIEPKNEEEKLLLDKESELSYVTKDLALCNNLIKQITSDNDTKNEKYEDYMTLSTLILALCGISAYNHNISLLAEYFSLIGVILALEASLYTFDAKRKNIKKLSLLEKIQSQIDGELAKKSGELEGILNAYKKDVKRRTEETIYTYSDLDKIESKNNPKLAKHPL